MPKLDDTMAYGRVGSVMLCLHSERDPSDTAWNTYADALAAGMEGDNRIQQILVFSAGGAPNGVQRGRITDLDAEPKPKTALLTDSRVARGAAVVISWFGTQIKAFPTSEVGKAIEWLEVAPEEQDEVIRLLETERAGLVGTR